MRRRFSKRGVVAAVLAASVVGPAIPAHAAPANDNFVDRISLGSLTVGSVLNAAGSNAGATEEAGEPDGCAAYSTVWFEVTVTEPGRLLLDLGGSNYDTTLGIYTGADVSSLTMLACNDDYQSLQSRLSRNLVPGTYAIQVGGFGGDYGDFVLAGSFSAVPELGFAGDEPQTAPTVTLPSSVSVDLTPYTASNEDEDSYCWGFPQTAWLRLAPTEDVVVQVSSSDDAVIGLLRDEGPYRSPLGCADFQIDESGWVPGVEFGKQLRAGESYLVQIQSWYEDAIVTLDLRQAAQPANDDFANAIPLAANEATFGNAIGATAEPGEPVACGSDAGVWYKYYPEIALASVASIERSDTWSMQVAIFKGDSLENLTLLDCGFWSANSVTLRQQPLWIRVTPDPYELQGHFVVQADHGQDRCTIIACVEARVGKEWRASAAAPFVYFSARKYEGSPRPFVCAFVLIGTCV
jgi:hypothetical protein